MLIGPLRVAPPSEADRTAYQEIVDRFGQFRPGSWPEKMASAEMLRARSAEEAQQLARRLAEFESPFLSVHPVAGRELDTRFAAAGLPPYV